MLHKKFIFPAVGAAALIAGGAAAGRLIRQWEKNPDPLHGESLTFPDSEQRSVDLPDGATIKTFLAGRGPTIVCVHGLTSNHLDWGPITPLLIEAGFSVLAIEQRGHGESTVGNAGFGSAQLGDDLAAVFEALDIKAAALMGHSMGGMASMSYAVRHSAAFNERVETLVLVATAGSLQTARHTLGLVLGGLTLPDLLRPPDDRLRAGTGLGAFGARPSLNMVDEAIAQFTRCDDKVRVLATSALRSHDVIDHLDTISVPTLVIGGTRDQLIRPYQVERLAEGIPGSQLEMFSGAGHMVIWERHVDMAVLITEWLRSDAVVLF